MRPQMLPFALAGAAGQLVYTAGLAIAAVLYARDTYHLQLSHLTLELLQQVSWTDAGLLLLWSLLTGALLGCGVGARPPRARALMAAFLGGVLVIAGSTPVRNAVHGAAPGTQLAALLAFSLLAPWFLGRFIRVLCYPGPSSP